MPLLRSTVIPDRFVHGFATREVDLAGVLDAHGLRPYRAHQVHGATVREVTLADDPAQVRGEAADIVMTASPGLAASVATADCVPILIAARDGDACAAVHAGWRGTAAAAAGAAVAAMAARYGLAPADLVAAIGPCICRSCYEVGAEVVAAFASLDPAAIHRAPDGRAHLDLRQANRTVLRAAGLAPDAIADVPGCTRCDPAARFHSFRRDRGHRGEQLAVIGRPAGNAAPPGPR